MTSNGISMVIGRKSKLSEDSPERRADRRMESIANPLSPDHEKNLRDYLVEQRTRLARGRYTLSEASLAIQLGDEGLRRSPVSLMSVFADAVDRGELRVWYPGGQIVYHSSREEVARLFYEEAEWSDLNEWLSHTGVLRTAWRFPDPSKPGYAFDQAGAEAALVNIAASSLRPKKSELDKELILEFFRAKKIDPTALPPRQAGASTIKKQVFAALVPARMTAKTFIKTWQALRDLKLIGERVA